MAVYEIDLLRALFADRLNDPSIFLASFYEQIQDPEQIDRYVEHIKELIDLQNRSDDNSNFKAMGIVSQVDEAEIVNIKQNFVVPMGYQVRLDINLNDRDYVLGKIKTLIDDLRGRKFELVIRGNGQIDVMSTPLILPLFNDKIRLFNNQKFWTEFDEVILSDPEDWSSNTDLITEITTKLETSTLVVGQKVYFYGLHQFDFGDEFAIIEISRLTGGALALTNIEYLTQNQQNPPKRFKISLSFNGVQSQEPYLNNGDDRVFLFFSGNATITDHRVTMGNDIVLQTLQEGKNTGTITTVETTEFPASLAIDDDTFSTFAMGHRTIDRNMKIGNRLSYTFVYDNSVPLYNALYRYARFGTGASTFANLIFTAKEYRYSFGVLTTDTYYAKISEASVQNTNGDVIMLTISLKVGDY